MKILHAYGIPDVIINLIIERMYTGTTAKVIPADGLTEIFKLLAQATYSGDTLKVTQ